VIELYPNYCSHLPEDEHEWLKNAGDCYAVKLHSYIQIELFKKFYMSD
jgi:hypothetical protein